LWQFVATPVFHDYKPPTLYDAGGNTRSRWYVEWYGFDSRKNKRVRFKKAIPLKFKFSASRYAWAKSFIDQINSVAAKTGGKFYTRSKVVVESYSVGQIVSKSLKIKKPQISERSLRDYESIANRLLNFIGKESSVCSFTKERALDFLNVMQRKRGWSNKTRNNTLHVLCAIFMPVVKDGTLAVNPFSGIESLCETVGDRRTRLLLLRSVTRSVWCMPPIFRNCCTSLLFCIAY